MISRLLAVLAPQFALKRAIAHRRLAQVKASFESGQITRTHPRRGDPSSPDTAMFRAGASIREAARYLDENHDISIGLLDDLVSNVVGEGLHIEQMSVTRGSKPAPAVDFNRAVNLAWTEWVQTADSRAELPWGELQRLICRSWLRDGDLLIQHVTGARYPYRHRIPYVLETLEADYLPFDLSEPSRQGRGQIIQGIEKDTWGRTLAYHVYREHPGNMLYSAALTTLRTATKRVAAEQMMHLKFSRRVGQTRGVSILHGVTTRLEDIKDYEESERIAARANAEIAGIIRNQPGLGSDTDNLNEQQREWRLENGMWLTQIEGESLETINPTRPNSGLADFRSSQLRAVASGTSTRYSALARDFSGSYSSQRQELVEGRIGYGKLRNYLIGRFYQVVRERFIDLGILAGVFSPPANLDPRSLYWADYRGPAMPWIDPEKENSARVDAVEAGFLSRQQVIRDMGNDPDVVDAQRAQDENAPEAEVTAWRNPNKVVSL